MSTYTWNLPDACPACQSRIASEKTERRQIVRAYVDGAPNGTELDVYALSRTYECGCCLRLIRGTLTPNVAEIESGCKNAVKLNAPSGGAA